jgi:hypothetical protein
VTAETGLTVDYGGGTVHWDGTSDSGSAAQSGSYMVKVSRSTGKGQTEVFTQSVTLLESSHDLLASASVFPNPAAAGEDRVLLNPGTAAGVRVTIGIYDLAGEAVAALDDHATGMPLVWMLDRQASGLYLARFQAEDAGGHRAARTFKIALVR